jgi:DNA-binding NtrC family response regulator
MTDSKVLPFVRKNRIMLIEDDDLVRSGLALALMSNGFRVHAMPTAEEAIKAVRHKIYNGIICDYHLPGMSGLDFFIQAKPFTTRSINILITAYGFDQIANSASIAGIDAFFEKPFTIQTLISGLNKAKRGRGQKAHFGRGGLQ